MVRATQVRTLVALGALALVCLLASLLAGSAHLSVSQALAALGGRGDDSRPRSCVIRLPHDLRLCGREFAGIGRRTSAGLVS
jgi:ABC-type enterobactin transport system permease subunit